VNLLPPLTDPTDPPVPWQCSAGAVANGVVVVELAVSDQGVAELLGHTAELADGVLTVAVIGRRHPPAAIVTLAHITRFGRVEVPVAGEVRAVRDPASDQQWNLPIGELSD
jgi:hypothetical protein